MQKDTLNFFVVDTNECALFAIGLSEIDKTNTLGVFCIHTSKRTMKATERIELTHGTVYTHC